MNSTQIVDSILSARYLREGEKTFEDICRRVASAVAGDKEEATDFYTIMVSCQYRILSPESSMP
jgi:ribonucleoside-diphosphate reductase alpha chain